MKTLFRKLLAPPSPRRMMVELLVIWLVVDAVMLWCAVSRHDEEWLEEVKFLIELRYLLPLSCVCAGQISASILWGLGGPGHWSQRMLLFAGLLAGVAMLWRAMITPLSDIAFPPVNELTRDGGLTLLLRSVTFIVLATIFRWCGAAIRQHSPPNAPSFTSRLSLADLFTLTTAVSMICFAVSTIPHDGWRSWYSWESAGSFQWTLLPTSMFVLIAALRRRRVLAYFLWLGIPLAFLNGFAVYVVVSNWGVAMLLQEWVSFALVNLFLLTYPLGLILSLEYLRLRGYTFAGKRQSAANGDGAVKACAAGDGT